MQIAREKIINKFMSKKVILTIITIIYSIIGLISGYSLFNKQLVLTWILATIMIILVIFREEIADLILGKNG